MTPCRMTFFLPPSSSSSPEDQFGRELHNGSFMRRGRQPPSFSCAVAPLAPRLHPYTHTGVCSPPPPAGPRLRPAPSGSLVDPSPLQNLFLSEPFLIFYLNYFQTTSEQIFCSSVHVCTCAELKMFRLFISHQFQVFSSPFLSDIIHEFIFLLSNIYINFK